MFGRLLPCFLCLLPAVQIYREKLGDSLFSTIHVSTDQVNLCLPIPSWKWASGMRCQLQIRVASLPQFRHPILVYLSLILVYLSLIPSSTLHFYLICQSLLQSCNVCEGGRLCLSGSRWRDGIAQSPGLQGLWLLIYSYSMFCIFRVLLQKGINYQRKIQRRVD